jgi:hypothetical protein
VVLITLDRLLNFYQKILGIGTDWKTLGTIMLDIHQVQIGGEGRLHEGLTTYYRRDEASSLSSATPFSSTEVTSLGKIATFVFKYRPMGNASLIIVSAHQKFNFYFILLNRHSEISFYRPQYMRDARRSAYDRQ